MNLKRHTTLLLLAIGLSMSINTNLNAQFDMGGPSKTKKKSGQVEIGNAQAFSKVQKKYQNKIVFSSSKIQKNNENPSLFKTEFNLGDPIYYRFYHDETLERKANKYIKKKSDEVFNTTYKDYAFGYVVSINGKELATFGKVIKAEKFTLNLVSASGIVFDKNIKNYFTSALSYTIRQAFLSLGNDFKPGKFKVNIKAYAFPTEAAASESKVENRIMPMFDGDLTINATEDGIKTYLPALCKNVGKPSTALDDPELEKLIGENFTKVYKGIVPEVVYLTSDRWSIYKNDYREIVSKNITATVMYINDKGSPIWLAYEVKRLFDGVKYGNLVFQRSYGAERICPQCIDYYKKNK